MRNVLSLMRSVALPNGTCLNLDLPTVAVKATYLKRPELLERSPLTEKDLAIIHKLEEKENKK